jgi:hypothetical protein
MNIFATCDRKQLRRIAELSTRLSYPAGSTITRRGGTGEETIIVCSGTVMLDVDGESIATADAGEIVGTVVPLTQAPGPRNVAMHALTDCDLMVFSRREMMALDTDLPGVAARMRAAATPVSMPVTLTPVAAR